MNAARPWSIRRRLLGWLLLPMLAVTAALLMLTWMQARATADAAFDRLLAASARAIAERVVVSDGEPEVDLPYVALELLASGGQDRVFYRVSGPHEAFITGYADLPPVPPSIRRSDAPRFHETVYRDEPVRVAVLERSLEPWGLAGTLRVEVVQTLGERLALARELLLASGLRLLLLVIMAAGIAGWAVHRGLAPLHALQAALRRRSARDLTPIADPVPEEITALVEAINHFMARLGDSLAVLQRFIGDASHQLRTPLAAVQAQLELALRETDPDTRQAALERVLAATQRTSRLAVQLLNLARVAPGGAAAVPVAVDLAALAAATAREAVPDALARGLDLGYEGAPADGSGPRIAGEPTMLRELLKNLIGNALAYCPRASTVTVRVLAAADATVRLEVEDDGPGIAPAERTRVTERFYRVPGTASEGCGLGLAIVRDVAERHGATLALLDGAHGRGLCVRIDFATGDAAPPATAGLAAPAPAPAPGTPA